MTKYSKYSTLILLSLLGVLSCTVSAQDFVPAEGADINNMLGTTWYEVAYYEPTLEPPNPETVGCVIYIFTPNEKEGFNYQLSSWEFPVEGERKISGQSQVIQPSEESKGKLYFQGVDDREAAWLILASAADNSWVVWADSYNFGSFISVCTQTGEPNEEAIAKGDELAAQYGYGQKHYVLQDPKQCDYDTLRASFK